MQVLKDGRSKIQVSELISLLPLLTDLARSVIEKDSKLIAKTVLNETKIALHGSLGDKIDVLLNSAFVKRGFDFADYDLAIIKEDHSELRNALTIRDSSGQLLLRSFVDSKFYIAIDRSWNAIYFLNREKGIGGVWSLDYSKISLSSYITPLRALFSWCVDDRGCELIHAAGIRIAGKGIALSGDSGSGKSTLAICAATSGCEILGDDAILVSGNDMYGIYTKAKIDLKSPFVDLDSLRAQYLSESWSTKAILNLDSEIFSLVSELPLDVFVLPVIGSGVSYSKLSKATVVKEFIPQTMKELLGGTTNNAKNLFQLVSSKPFYRLELGPIMEDNLKALYEIASMV